MAVVLLGIISSCASVKTVSPGMLTGSWKVSKISPVHTPQDPNNTNPPSTDKGGAQASLDDKSGTGGNEINEKLNTLQAQIPEVKSSMEFRKDKSATYTIKDKSVNGTWNLDVKAKKVSFIPGDGSPAMIFEITKMDSKNLSILERFSKGDVNLMYTKQ